MYQDIVSTGRSCSVDDGFISGGRSFMPRTRSMCSMEFSAISSSIIGRPYRLRNNLALIVDMTGSSNLAETTAD